MRVLISSLLVAACYAAPTSKAAVKKEDKKAEAFNEIKPGTLPGSPVHVAGVPTFGVYNTGLFTGEGAVNNVVEAEHGSHFRGAIVNAVPTTYVASNPLVATHHTAAGNQVVATSGVGSFNAASHGAVRVGTPVVGAIGTPVFGAIATPAVASVAQPTIRLAGAHAVQLPTVGAVKLEAPAVAAVQYHKPAAIAVAPAVAPVQYQVPAVAAVPTAVTYQSEQRVALPPKEVDVHVQHKTVHVPIEKRVHYGVKNVVTGSTTQVHKPTLNVPQIKAPEVFVEKTQHAAPEVTLTHSEVTVENKSPNYVNAPYDAGVVVQKAAPKFEETHVPTPVKVAKPYAVPKPYDVPVPQTVKVKSAIKPVHHVDVHSVKTENVVTPVQYAAHHHVVSQPAVAVHQPAVAVHQPAVAVKAGVAVQPSIQLAQAVQKVDAVHGTALGVAHGAVGVPYGAVAQGTVGVHGAVGVHPAHLGVHGSTVQGATQLTGAQLLGATHHSVGQNIVVKSHNAPGSHVQFTKPATYVAEPAAVAPKAVISDV